MLKHQFVLIGVGPLLHRNCASRKFIPYTFEVLYLYTKSYAY